MKIAVYGGSFDCPTLGHTMVVAHLLLNDPSIDQIYVVPCYQQKGKSLTDFNHRITMCEKAFSHFSRTKVLPIEKELGGESLTVRLLKTLTEREPDSSFRFIMGSDLLETAPKWQGWDEIQTLAPP